MENQLGTHMENLFAVLPLPYPPETITASVQEGAWQESCPSPHGIPESGIILLLESNCNGEKTFVRVCIIFPRRVFNPRDTPDAPDALDAPDGAGDICNSSSLFLFSLLVPPPPPHPLTCLQSTFRIHENPRESSRILKNPPPPPRPTEESTTEELEQSTILIPGIPGSGNVGIEWGGESLRRLGRLERRCLI